MTGNRKDKKPKCDDIEVAPDAWERFERAIDKVTKSVPKSHKRGVAKGGAQSRHRAKDT